MAEWVGHQLAGLPSWLFWPVFIIVIVFFAGLYVLWNMTQGVALPHRKKEKKRAKK